MPLDKSGSKKSIGKNIKSEMKVGKPKKQAIAIALNVAREHGAKIPKEKEMTLFFIAFAILSIICFSTEVVEIMVNETIWYSDHLHNAIDHIMYLIVNYIGYNLNRK